MSCVIQLASVWVAIVLAGSSIVVARWGVDYLKKVNAEDGGWRATYARIVPYWSGTALAITSPFMAAYFFARWLDRCTAALSPGIWSMILLSVGAALFLVSIGRLIAGRIRTDRRYPPSPKWEDPSETVRQDHRAQWRARRTVVTEYAILSVVACGLTVVAFVLM